MVLQALDRPNRSDIESPAAEPGPAGGSVRGRVVDASGGVIVGAEVQLEPAAGGATVSATTDREGYAFEAVAPGAYLVTVRHAWPRSHPLRCSPHSGPRGLRPARAGPFRAGFLLDPSF
ncbi:MAG: carboxypeptidase regulatory-like domain-containing protein [Acidobacteria bacterium]|nr:carboxypeptidase regulatory-like domain-containing protein [Acidobacteriota bacterium]